MGLLLIGKTTKEKYEYDQKKVDFAQQKGYLVYVIRSDMNADEQNQVVDQLIKGVIERGKIFQINQKLL